MTLRATSHGDLQNLSLSRPSLDNGMYKSFSISSNNMTSRFGKDSMEEIKGVSKPSHPPRRPVRAVRPVSAMGVNGSFLQINHLHGELVRKRKVRISRIRQLIVNNTYLSVHHGTLVSGWDTSHTLSSF